MGLIIGGIEGLGLIIRGMRTQVGGGIEEDLFWMRCGGLWVNFEIVLSD